MSSLPPRSPESYPPLPDYEVLLRQPLRWLLPWGIVWAACALALADFGVLVERTALLGLQAPGYVVRHEAAISLALNGRPPTARELAPQRMPRQSSSGKPLPPALPDDTGVEIEGASYHLHPQGLRKELSRHAQLVGTLSFRLHRPASGATLMWVCGRDLAPPGALPDDSADRTDLPPATLPATCRTPR